MLVVTGVIWLVKSCLDQVPKWGLISLSFPYTVSYDPSFHGAFSTYQYGMANTKCYLQFVANSKYNCGHWVWHVVIQATSVIFLLYQALLEDNFRMEICVHLFIGISILVSTVFSYIPHLESNEISNFMNELLAFEKRWLAKVNTRGNNYWRNVDYRRFVIIVLGLFRITLPLASITIAISLAILPYSPWRFLLIAILNSFSVLSGGNNIIEEIIRRAASLIFTYLSLHLCVNHYLTIASTTFFSAQSSIFWMVLAFKKLFATNNSLGWVESCRNVYTTVTMFREIQVLCVVFNQKHKILVMPTLIIVADMTTSVSIFVLVSSWGNMNLPTAIIFGNMLLMGLGVVLLLFLLAVKVFTESKKLLRLHIWCHGQSDTI